MASAWVPTWVKDKWMRDAKRLADPVEWVLVEEEGPLLEGPVCARVAVVDFEPSSGALRPGVPFVPPSAAREQGRGRYLRKRDLRLDDPASMAVSVFGAVLKTIQQFERPDCLGRPVRWAFDGPQLLVVPRAGEWANAYYERESRSLQFFAFDDARGRRVFTAQSQDIVSHETGHAILDGIAPDLYDATTPQSLALHEAMADVTALIGSLRSAALRRSVLRDVGENLNGWNGFSALAGEFGHALDPARESLRGLYERHTMQRTHSDEPHDLSVVLSGALYGAFLYMFDEILEERLDRQIPTLPRLRPHGGDADDDGGDEEATDEAPIDPHERALAKAGRRLRRTILRALDYLPPGEVSFADFARAVLAADQATHPDSVGQREWLGKELARRGIVGHARELGVRTMLDVDAVRALDLDDVVASDFAAYRFVEANRGLLGIPDEIPFKLAPRLATRKSTWHEEGREDIEEVLVKVAWTTEERISRTVGAPWRTRLVVRGTTLAIDRGTRKVRALLTGSCDASMRDARDRALRSLLASRLLVDADEAAPRDGAMRAPAVRAHTVNGALRTRGTAHALHVLRATPPASAGRGPARRRTRR